MRQIRQRLPRTGYPNELRALSNEIGEKPAGAAAWAGASKQRGELSAVIAPLIAPASGEQDH
jgi:hypothetical protein